MEEQRFWEIIATSKPGKGSIERQTARLTKALSKLELEEVVDFHQAFVETNRRLYTWAHWGAAELLFGGCGDDHFTDFRSWVVAQGRDGLCRAAHESPRRLGSGHVATRGLGAAAPRR